MPEPTAHTIQPHTKQPQRMYPQGLALEQRRSLIQDLELHMEHMGRPQYTEVLHIFDKSSAFAFRLGILAILKEEMGFRFYLNFAVTNFKFTY